MVNIFCNLLEISYLGLFGLVNQLFKNSLLNSLFFAKIVIEDIK